MSLLTARVFLSKHVELHFKWLAVLIDWFQNISKTDPVFASVFVGGVQEACSAPLPYYTSQAPTTALQEPCWISDTSLQYI